MQSKFVIRVIFTFELGFISPSMFVTHWSRQTLAASFTDDIFNLIFLRDFDLNFGEIC